MIKTRLKDLREDYDLLQKDIAKILGLTQRAYSWYETGKNVPNEILIKLADFYKVSTDYILYRTDERKPYPKSIMK